MNAVIVSVANSRFGCLIARNASFDGVVASIVVVIAVASVLCGIAASIYGGVCGLIELLSL